MTGVQTCALPICFHVQDLVLEPVASSDAVLSSDEKELGVALIDMGGGTTDIAIFFDDAIRHTAVISLGGKNVTSDIAIGLRTSIDTAEEVKIRYGNANAKDVQKRGDIDLSRITEGEVGLVSRHHVAEIIEARVEEIFKLADVELAKIERSGKLPAGVILCGGGAKLEGIVSLARKMFKLPASVGTPKGVKTAIDKIDDPALATVVGLVRWGENLAHTYGENQGLLDRFSVAGDVSTKVKKWFRNFIP